MYPNNNSEYGWNPDRNWPPSFKPALESIEKKLISGTSTDIRVKAEKQTGEEWGAGLDEEIATRIQKQRQKSGNIGQDLSSAMTWTRERTSDLIWTTNDGGIAGHPGAVKKLPGLRGFVMSEHNTRDNARYEGVMTEIDAYDNSTASVHDISIKARLMTIQKMMSPAEELLTATSSHFVQSSVISQLNQPGAMNQLSVMQQQKRETLKWETARDMMIQKHTTLVPQTYQDYLSHTNGDVGQAMDIFQQHVQQKKVVPNTATTSQTDDMRSITIAGAAKMTTGRPRALSDARRI
ncbi:hypothetical protein [Cellvibrio sp. PSBB006]|jgi:hypothetical protein|uniref:hypothetical protein n=1 Tax=Cellvibrio sp. PSBB006 TaxID=1987723 RepID=UPI000B3B9AC3|nr:hypothetical protein [Cellvibrio sp. PSBB006]ARU26651.1 hypothetical protein CBR65_03970 [Cellvibrio sp. PSBB006]